MTAVTTLAKEGLTFNGGFEEVVMTFNLSLFLVDGIFLFDSVPFLLLLIDSFITILLSLTCSEGIILESCYNIKIALS